MNDDRTALDDFSGTARLFPLPGLVFFPKSVQALNVFEPRYRQMTADALDDDRLITLVLLSGDVSQVYEHRAAIHPVGCLGRIVADQLLPDGRYHLILRGLARVRILDEPPTDKLYRPARVKVLHDVSTDDLDALRKRRAKLAELILPRINDGAARDQLQALFDGELPLGAVCDSLAFSLPLPPEAKQELLETLDVLDRARRLADAFQELVERLASASTSGKSFPPGFSDN